MGTLMKPFVDKQLTNVSNKLVPEGYISEMILPLITSKFTSGLLAGYGNDHLRILNTIAGGRQGYQMATTRTKTTQNYNIATHGLKDILTEEDIDNELEPFNAEVDLVDFLTTLLWMSKEKGLADVMTLTATYAVGNSVTLAGTDQYSDYANSTPLNDFAVARSAIKDKSGQVPDMVVMSWEVMQQLKYHPELVRSLGYADSRPGGLKNEELASVMEVKKIVVGTVTFNDAVEGQTDDLKPVWNKDIIFLVRPERGAKRQVSFGYRFQKQGQAPRRVTKEQLKDPVGAMKILVDDKYDQLISNSNAGYLIKNAVA